MTKESATDSAGGTELAHQPGLENATDHESQAAALEPFPSIVKDHADQNEKPVASLAQSGAQKGPFPVTRAATHTGLAPASSAGDLPGPMARSRSAIAAGKQNLDPPFALLDKAGTTDLDRAIWEGNQETSDESSSEDEDIGATGQVNQEKQQQLQEQETNDEKPEKRGWWRRKLKNDGCDYHRFRIGNDNYQTKGRVKHDGRLRISLKDTSSTGYLARVLGSAAHRMVPSKSTADAVSKFKRPQPPRRLSSDSTAAFGDEPPPKLNIVIMVIGSRGDIQPFIRIGKVLKEQHGHRVRIATHPVFRDFVEKESGLELFSVGGDPSELMAFMVKNPGMIPTLETVKAGEIGKRRDAMAEMFEGFWRACICATDDEADGQNIRMMGLKEPFIADAIIANPPSFAHIHCAEALGIPLHLMFTFPYTPTQAFPHPLASIKRSNVDPGYTNFISYPLVEMMVWQGLGDLVNDFRVNTLGLDAVSTLWAPGSVYRLHVPFTYLWSPGLIPKPADWGSNIDVSGFVFLELASTYKPPKDLEDFLNAGEPPIYVGFGSIVVDDADRFTEMIFKAIKLAGVRALVSKGWGGFGNGEAPEGVFMLDNVPHDWLFPRIKGCVIHGGAGTTAIALKCGKPTMVVPFFGDQYFWGSMISKSGVGPDPVPYKQLSEEKLAEGIKYLLTDEAKEAAEKIAQDIAAEGDGAANAVSSFHRHLSLQGASTMRCCLLPDRTAGWQLKNTRIKFSPLAADILVSQGLLSWKRLRLPRQSEWNDLEGPGGPLSGIATSLVGTVRKTVMGVGAIPYNIVKAGKKHDETHNKTYMEKQTKRHSVVAEEHPIINGNEANSHGPGRNNAPAINRPSRSFSASVAADMAEEYGGHVGRGFGKSAYAIAKAPADLALALAQGFHNAPRLYGDDTVRKPTRVTGFKSGLVAARNEFGYGVYDAWTGLVRLPVHGAKKDGVGGFFKGTAKGTVSFVLKNVSAVMGPIGYTMKGGIKQIERYRGPRKQVRLTRISQGRRHARQVPLTERRDIEREVVYGFTVMRDLYEEIVRLQKRAGLKGHFDHIFHDIGILFEDVPTAQRALTGLRRGQTVDQVRAEARAAAHRKGTEKPRRATGASHAPSSGPSPPLRQGTGFEQKPRKRATTLGRSATYDEPPKISADSEARMTDGADETEKRLVSTYNLDKLDDKVGLGMDGGMLRPVQTAV